MDEKTLTALLGSIKKWEAIVAGTGTDNGQYNCPLCQAFIDARCTGCPVKERTGAIHCAETPYEDYVEDGTVESAQRELDFLRSLLPAETTEQPTKPTMTA